MSAKVRMILSDEGPDVEDEFGQQELDETYTLEVSSPGLDRPLRHEGDYRRFEGRLAKLVTSEPIGRQSAFAGRIKGVEEGSVLLEEGRKTHRVPLAKIKRGQLDVEFSVASSQSPVSSAGNEGTGNS